MSKFAWVLIISLLLVGLVFLSGCTTTSDGGQQQDNSDSSGNDDTTDTTGENGVPLPPALPE